MVALTRSEPMNLLTRLSPQAARRVAAEYVQRSLCGAASVPSPHPACLDLEASPPIDRSLPALVSVLDATVAAERRHWTRSAVLGDLIGPSLTVLQREYPIPAHRLFLQRVDAPDYRPHKVVTSTHGVEMIETSEASELPNSLGTELEWSEATIKSYSGFAQISRSDMLDDRQLGVLARLSNALVACAFRHEAGLVYDVLTGTPELADGPLFDTTNSTTGANLSWQSVDELQHLLATQTDSKGNYLCLEMATLLVPTDPAVTAALETSTLPAPALSALGRGALRIVRTPYLTNQVIALCDPVVAAAVVISTLTAEPVLSVNNRLPIALTAVGLELSVQNSVAIVPASRKGVARWTLSA